MYGGANKWSRKSREPLPSGEGVTLPRIAGFHPSTKPLYALCRRSVSEALGLNLAARHSLQPVVADRCRSSQSFFGIAGIQFHPADIEAPLLRRVVTPNARITICLQLQSDRCAVHAGPRIRPHTLIDTQ